MNGYKTLSAAFVGLVVQALHQYGIEIADGNDVGLQQQDILGTARQNRKLTRRLTRPLPRTAGEAAQSHDLRGIGDREQELIGADVHGDDARRG